MTDEENIRFIECVDDRFEIIAKAKKHIIEATNIEMSQKEMEVLDNFLFRCWQMDWLKNDYKALEKENEQLQEHIREVENDSKNCEIWSYGRIKELKEEIAALQKYIETLSENYENEIAEHKKVIEKMKNCRNCKYFLANVHCNNYYDWKCNNLDKWELAE